MAEEEQVEKHVRAKPIPKPPVGDQISRSLYQLCYYYSQYTLQDARALPYHQVLRMLQVAQQEKAAEFLQLTNITAAPHTKKGSGVRKIANQYKKVAQDG